VVLSRDVTERKLSEDKIEHLAYYDTLTGLPNRRLLMDRLRQALLMGARNDSRGALLFIDLDNFKTLNDTLGHDMATCCCNRQQLELLPVCANAIQWRGWAGMNSLSYWKI